MGIMMVCAIMPATASAQPCTAVPGNLVVNCGFETGTFSGWTVAWPPTADPDTFVDGSPHSGAFAASLGAVPGENSVSQRIIGTLPGRMYTVSFWLANDDGDTVPNEFHVQWNGLEILSLHNTNGFAYRQFSFTVIAIGHDTLRFDEQQVPAFFHLDDVVVALDPIDPIVALEGPPKGK